MGLLPGKLQVMSSTMLAWRALLLPALRAAMNASAIFFFALSVEEAVAELLARRRACDLCVIFV
jgi:ABC-type spermidine/putrescine transport system permease subunit II